MVSLIATACDPMMQKRLLSLREVVWVTIVGCTATPLAIWLFARVVHSSKVASAMILVLMIPYAALTRWGRSLPDWTFWSVFALAQLAYLIFGFLVFRTVIRYLRA
jgi:hypothetical protein